MALLSPVSLGSVEILIISQENIILTSPLAPEMKVSDFQKWKYFDICVQELV